MTYRKRQWTAHGALVCTLLLAALLRSFPPETSSFYPRCPVFVYLHLLCPGCGGTRAVAALLRGNITDAWRCNALVVGTLPLTLAFIAASYRRALQRKAFCWPAVSSHVLVIGLTLAGVFTIVRNLS